MKPGKAGLVASILLLVCVLAFMYFVPAYQCNNIYKLKAPEYLFKCKYNPIVSVDQIISCNNVSRQLPYDDLTGIPEQCVDQTTEDTCTLFHQLDDNFSDGRACIWTDDACISDSTSKGLCVGLCVGTSSDICPSVAGASGCSQVYTLVSPGNNEVDAMYCQIADPYCSDGDAYTRCFQNPTTSCVGTAIDGYCNGITSSNCGIYFQGMTADVGIQCVTDLEMKGHCTTSLQSYCKPI